MINPRLTAIAIASALAPPCFGVHGASVRLVSGTLAWHGAAAEVPAWIEACSRSYTADAAGVWRPTDSAAARTGWSIEEARPRIAGVDTSATPPCNVYRANRQTVPVRAAAFDQRRSQIARVPDGLDAEVIAFQEVSGEAAVREASGSRSPDYSVCSYNRYKLQRLAFAWKRRHRQAVEGGCQGLAELSLPEAGPAAQVRPDGTCDLATPMAAGVVTRNRWLEINDGAPPTSRGTLLSLVCGGPAVFACDAVKRPVFTAEEQRTITERTGPGCGNGIGLDHIVVSQHLVATLVQSFKAPLGQFGATLAAKPPQHPDPLLAVSDHCSVVSDADL